MRVLCVLLSIFLSPFTQADSLVSQRVAVIDATGKPAQSGMTVVIEKDQIVAIGPWTLAESEALAAKPPPNSLGPVTN